MATAAPGQELKALRRRSISEIFRKLKYFHFEILSLSARKKSKLNFGKSQFNVQTREWQGKNVKIVITSNLFSMPVPDVLDEMERCVREFNQGPNVLLLNLSDFTEKNIQALKFVVSLFGPNALKHSIVVFNDEQKIEPCTKILIEECEGRSHVKSTESFDQLMKKVNTMVENNKGSFVTLTDVFIPKKKIVKMNLVFCGSKGFEKTQTTKAILGPATCDKPSSSSECVKRQAEVSGRLVSIVELPALSEKPKIKVLDECWSCVSMCEPEGVHAFVQVLPLGPLTDEDKAEFKTIQKTFSSSINSFTVILFTVESDPKAQVFTEFVKHLRIVLIGKTGSGKSSSGNSILGRNAFKSDIGQKAITKFCQKEHNIVNSCRVEVVDTPGLFDKSMSNQEINDEMIKCISLLAPGPHVFLLVLGIGRFTPEENETVNLIKKGFGSDAQKYIIVLFTHGDELDKNKISIEDFIKEKCDDSCQKLIFDCGNRYHVFNNRDGSKRQRQVNELIQKIDALVEENGGSCYTNEMLKEAEAAIQREAERIMKEKEEEFKKEKQEMEDKHKQEILEIQQKMEEEREETERLRQEKDNERRQMEAKITHERELRKKEQEMRDKEEQERKELDRIKQQEYEQSICVLEENFRQNFDLKSKENLNKMEKERQVWEEQMKECEKQYTEDKKRRLEEQEQLEQEYKNKYEIWKKENEELQLRCEKEERERKELEEKHKQHVDDLRKTFKEEARRQAEEFNEFKERKDIDFAALIEKHLEEVTSLKNKNEQKQRKYQSLKNLAAHNETELKREAEKLKTDMEQLQTQHKDQLIDLAIIVLTKEKENSKLIKDSQKKHASELEKCKKDNKHEYDRELKREIEKLKTKQNQEMKDLDKDTDTSSKRTRELSDKHKKQLSG